MVTLVELVTIKTNPRFDPGILMKIQALVLLNPFAPDPDDVTAVPFEEEYAESPSPAAATVQPALTSSVINL